MSPTPAAPSAPVEHRFQAVAALKDAAVAAGLPCPKWNQDNVVEVAAESGTCDDSSVLSTYATAADLQTAVENMRSMNKMIEDSGSTAEPLLIGPNWIINAPGADKVAGALGGTVER